MRFEFHPEALAEYEDAARYYAGCQKGLELRFIAAVEHVIQQIIESSERWPVLEEDIRRCLTRVFPYAVLYSVDYILIISLMHSHREPGYWRKRIANPAN
ncbi:MAG: type II toxin-antitoxin system RelE/ParE family toxin [Pseudomonadota bacterium]